MKTKALKWLFVAILVAFYFDTGITAYGEDSHSDEHHENEHASSHDDEHARHEKHEGHDEHDEDSVRLEEKHLSEFEITLTTASSGVLKQSINVPGEIVSNQDTLSHIAPRFAGIAKEVLKDIGDKVKAGDVLAVVESSESLSEYKLRSLIDGTIIAKHITRGELITGDDETFTVADLSDVWINLSIYQADLAVVEVGQKVRLSQGHDQPETEGLISYLSPVVDEHTRTAVARVVIPNPNGLWRPGLFVTGEVITKEKSVSILVPKAALETVEGKVSVFVKTSEGFRPQAVALGEQNDEFAEVVSGLTERQQYVAKHGFTLKAELLKASFSGHGHAH